MKAKYVRIREKLGEMIKDLPQDSKVESERDLALILKASRMTVRKAIDELVQERILYRTPSQGTFVAKKGHRKYLNNLLGFSNEVLQQGGVPSRKVLKLETLKADKFLATKLEINEGDPVQYVVRVHMRDNIPLLIDYAYFNTTLTGVLTKNMCEASLYNYFEDKKYLTITTSVQEFKAEMINQEVSTILNLKNDIPIIRVEHTTYLDNGSALEYTIGYRNPEKYNLISIAKK
jgi:GntR family transcriptional regulator